MKKTESEGIIDVFIKILLLSLLLVWSFAIIRPFITLMAWSLIVAVALYPMRQKLLNLTKGRKKGLVTFLFIAVLIAMIMVPAIKLTSSIIASGKEIYQEFDQGILDIPELSESVKNWPVLGERIYSSWSSASADLEDFVIDYKEQIKKSIGWLFSSIGGLMGAMMLALIALIIAGVFMSSAGSGHQAGVKFINRLMPGQGEEFLKMCTDTIRSVVKGILLVAVIQAALAYLGFVIIKLPAAGIFALIVLIFAIMQIPALLAMIPAVIMVFSYAETTPAIIFTIYIIIVALSDNLLKPMLLGKGIDTPMLLILIGALGGMMLQGILGLFIGPVVLALAYQLYQSWVNQEIKAENTSLKDS